MPDFQYFYEFEVPVERVKYRGSQGKGRCPLGTHDDIKPSFSFSIDTGQCKCFSCGYTGNAYLLAKHLNLDNPERMINGEPSLKKPRITPKKPQIRVGLDDIAAEYIARVPEEHKKSLPKLDLMKVGYTEDGLKVFNYLDVNGTITGIKIHKSYWVEGNKSCQIYGLNLLSKYNKNKPLMICEGETDMLVCPSNAISFSAGAGSIPEDIAPILEFKQIYIAYDHDSPGREGAERLAQHIKKKSRGIKVMICQWSEFLDDGYDIRDEFAKFKADTEYQYDELKAAMQNAVEFKLPRRGFEVVSNHQLAADPTPPVDHIVQYLLYEGGVTLVAGTDGVGKTWFALQMAYAIASGTEFIGFHVNKRPVLLVQFELSIPQIKERSGLVHVNFPRDTDVKIAKLGTEDMMFTEQWNKIKDTIDDMGMRDGVVIVDNIYSSSSAKLSDNSELQSLLSMIHMIKTKTGNAIVLIGHHNKHTNHEEEPMLTKGLIHGGKHLTNYVSNVFQIGESTLGTDLRRGKITKIRDEDCDLKQIAFKLNWDSETLMFERGAVIVNEKLHCMAVSEKWEIKLLKQFYGYVNHKEFDRKRIWTFLEADQGWMPTTYNINNKLTRYLKTMVGWGFLLKEKHGLYSFNHKEMGE